MGWGRGGEKEIDFWLEHANSNYLKQFPIVILLIWTEKKNFEFVVFV